MENVGIDELIEFDKSKEKSNLSKQIDKLKTNFQKTPHNFRGVFCLPASIILPGIFKNESPSEPTFF